MHGFLPAAFIFGPALLFFGLLKIALFVLLIVLIVRLVSHGHRHPAYAHGGGHGYGRHDTQGADPRRVAAWRYAAGQIDRAEFDRITAGLDAAAGSAPTTPPSTPTPPVA